MNYTVTISISCLLASQKILKFRISVGSSEVLVRPSDLHPSRISSRRRVVRKPNVIFSALLAHFFSPGRCSIPWHYAVSRQRILRLGAESPHLLLNFMCSPTEGKVIVGIVEPQEAMDGLPRYIADGLQMFFCNTFRFRNHLWFLTYLSLFRPRLPRGKQSSLLSWHAHFPLNRCFSIILFQPG